MGTSISQFIEVPLRNYGSGIDETAIEDFL